MQNRLNDVGSAVVVSSRGLTRVMCSEKVSSRDNDVWRQWSQFRLVERVIFVGSQQEAAWTHRFGDFLGKTKLFLVFPRKRVFRRTFLLFSRKSTRRKLFLITWSDCVCLFRLISQNTDASWTIRVAWRVNSWTLQNISQWLAAFHFLCLRSVIFHDFTPLNARRELKSGAET